MDPPSIRLYLQKHTHTLSYYFSPAKEPVQLETLFIMDKKHLPYRQSSEINSWKHRFSVTGQRHKPQPKEAFHFRFEHCAVPLRTFNSVSQAYCLWKWV